MSKFEKLNLSNGIKVILKINPNTPKGAINLFFNHGIKYEEKAGTTALTARLLFQGTKTRTAEELAKEIDLYAIGLGSDAKPDYLKVTANFLNEDLDKALELMEDIVNNSTFELFDKEVNKLKGEIDVELDSARAKAVDNLVKNMFKNHPYGNSSTKVLDSLKTLKKEDIQNFYSDVLSAENAVISAVGDFDKEKLITGLEKAFGKIKAKSENKKQVPEVQALNGTETVQISKDDASQAQIYRGWLAPSILDKDYPAVALLNMILGASGLSSRLFVELRDKQGLAYVVRSGYDAHTLSGGFNVYIATEPKNIEVSLNGFKNEIKKLQDNPVDEEELSSAKENITGKRSFFHETNSQQAHYLGYYEIIGLGAEFDETITEKIKAVTAVEIQEAAKKYLGEDSVISLLAPASFLK